MNTAITTERITEASLQVCARIGGVLYLMIRSTFLPRTLGMLSVLGGVGWLSFLYPPLGYRRFPYIAAFGVLGAVSLILWLLVFGLNEQRWKEQESAAGNDS
jgi:hypothetical protein